MFSINGFFKYNYVIVLAASEAISYIYYQISIRKIINPLCRNTIQMKTKLLSKFQLHIGTWQLISQVRDNFRIVKKLQSTFSKT